MDPADTVSFVTAFGVLLGLFLSVAAGYGFRSLIRHLRATDKLPVSRSEKTAGIVGAVLFIVVMCVVPRSIALWFHGEEIDKFARQLEDGEKEYRRKSEDLQNKLNDLQREYDRPVPTATTFIGGAEWEKMQDDRRRSEREHLSAEIKMLREKCKHNDTEWNILQTSRGNYKPQYQGR